MTNREAIEVIERLGVDSRGYPKLEEAINMAIEALSNTPNTFNTLEALGITDKQINMAIGAITHMLKKGYYSDDMEDALNAVIKALQSAQPEQECEKCIFKPFKQFQTELIRCKDCKDYQTDWEIPYYPNRHYCATMDSTMPEDGFCSYAERKDNG